MALYTNRIDVTLTAEQSAGVDAAVTGLETALDFVISLGTQERRHLFKLGAGSEAFAQQAHAIARENTEIIPVGSPWRIWIAMPPSAICCSQWSSG